LKINDQNHKLEKRIVKYKYLLGASLAGMGGGGIFTSSARNALLTKGEKSSDFWYDRRNNIENALIDMRLFIETAGDKNVNAVINEEKLRPVVETLLWYPVVEHSAPDLNKAEVARLCIRAGFNYLKEMKKIPLSSERTIEEAVDLSDYLVELFKPETERRYSPPKRSPSKNSGYGGAT
jgi:hypothetical protein